MSKLGPIIVLIITIIFALSLIGMAAMAHDAEHPELNNWFMSLSSKAGNPCCDGSDAMHLSDVEWKVGADGHYKVFIYGEWVDVPPSSIIDRPNKDGRTLVWPVKISDKWWVRCFLPGAGS